MSGRVSPRVAALLPVPESGTTAQIAGPSKEPPAKTSRAIASKERSVLSALSLHRLDAEIDKMTSAQIKAAVQEFERRHPPDMSDPVSFADLPVGKTAFIPLNRIQPGQVQISWDNVKEKMKDIVRRMVERKEELIEEKKPIPGAPSLLEADDAFKGVISSKGAFVQLDDNHHHAAALQAVETVVERLLDSVPKGNRAPNDTRVELELVRRLFGGDGVPKVPVKIDHDLSGMSEAQSWQVRSEGIDDKKVAYLKTRSGRVLKAAPSLFSQLEDNPFRYLASQLCAKVSVRTRHGERELRIKGADNPVWIKVRDQAPDFIEFLLAEALERSFKELGIRYDPRHPVTEKIRIAARFAILRAKSDPQDPLHEALHTVAVIAKDHSLTHIEDNIELKGRRVVVSDRYLEVSDRLQMLAPLVEGIAKQKLSVDLKFQPGVRH